MMKTKLTILFAALLMGTFMFSSCDVPVSLGKMLNLDPPVVLIERPDFMEDANQFMTIEGTATDNEEVAFLFLSVEQVVKEGTASWKHDWRSVRGSWEWHNARGAWDNINANDAPTATETVWDSSAGKNNIRWSITLDVRGLDNGEYIISVNAENNVKNTGAVEQRRFIVDHEPPAVEIKSPLLEFDDYGKDAKFNYQTEIEPQLKSYELRDAAVLDKLHNERITIQYEIEDDFSIATLVFQLYDNDGECYYNADGNDVTELGFDLGWSGKIVIDASEIGSPVAGGYPLFLQVISAAGDKAGNEKKRSHGWLVWCPDADKPWVEGIGVEDRGDAVNNARIYPGSDVQGQAFDDDGLARVEYTLFSIGNPDVIYKEKGNAFTGTLENTPLIPDSDPSTFFSWGFNAPLASGTYKVVIDCWDINGTKGDTTERYIYVYPLDTLPLLMSIGSSITGTYSLGDEVVIYLVLREPVDVSGEPKLKLTDFNAFEKYAVYTRMDENKMVFVYTVEDGDNAEALELAGIDFAGVSINIGDKDVTDELQEFEDDLGSAGHLSLKTYATITIDTIVPRFVPLGSGLNEDGSVLTLKFSKEIYKRQGNITITQTGDYYPPAVMDKADFQRWGGAAVLGAYYEVGTNGTDSAGNVDTSEKYILKYDIDPAGASANVLRNLLKGMNAHVREIPVVSPRVTINASDRTVMTVDLSPASGFELRVKGVSYDVTIDGGLVQDQEGKPTVGDSEILNQVISGVNRPFIRVDRAGARTKVTQGPGETITIPGEPVYSGNWYWVKYAEIYQPTGYASIPTNSGGEDWQRVDQFYTLLNGNRDGVTFNENDSQNAAGNNVGITNAWADGRYYRGNPALSEEAWQTIWGTDAEGLTSAIVRVQGNFETAATDANMQWNFYNVQFWVNPYERPLAAGDPAEEHSTLGNFRVQRLYVNVGGVATDTATNGDNAVKTAVNTMPAGMADDAAAWAAGWLRVSESTPGQSSSIEVPGLIINQPSIAYVRIDTQTPGADISYTIETTTTAPQSGETTLFDGSSHPAPVTVTMPSNATDNTNNPFQLGDNTTNGLLFGIAARASKDGSASDLSYEKVSRSVITFNNIAEAGNWGDLRGRARVKGRSLHLWIRGGDGLSGDSLTPGFPLQWSDMAKGGAGLFSGDDDGDKVWISWEVSVPAYFHFIAGTTALAADVADGPWDWGWAKNSWSFQHHRYPLHPGGSMYFVVGGESSLVVNSATQFFEFYNTGFSGGR